MENTTRVKSKIIATSIVMLILIFAPMHFLIFRHDLYLRQLSRGIETVHHPPNTQHVASASDIGLLIGNGDHCDYFVAELRNYHNSSPYEIEAFYKSTKIWNPLNKKAQAVSIAFVEHNKVQFYDGSEADTELFKDRFQPILNSLKNQHLYFVFFLDVGNSVGCDIRCL